MTRQTTDLRSKLSKARGLGSAHHGVSHWWLQRVTAVALVPTSLWLVYSLLAIILSPDVGRIAVWLAVPVNAFFTILFLIAGFYHAKLGVQVVVEDYVHGPFAKYLLLLLNTFVCFTFAAIGIVAVLKLHFLDITSASL